MTLLQCIQDFINNITVTDKQEEGILSSLSNLNNYLLAKENNLNIESSFTNGSYERDTIIRPLNDIDVFAVLEFEKWKDEFGTYPDPQSVLTKIKNYLNDQSDYKGKVKQDRPCITIELSNKDFDILPSFYQMDGGYLIPNHDLKSWTYSYPKQLTESLNSVNRLRGYKVKQTIRAVKYWNKENNQKVIPSYHIEEIAVHIFTLNNFSNIEESIRLWFSNAEFYLQSYKFRTNDDYATALRRIKKVRDKINEAYVECQNGGEKKAIQIWKEIFQREFPTISEEEAKNFSKALSEGALKIAPTGILSTTEGSLISTSKGFFGDVY